MAGSTALQLYSYPTSTDQAGPAGIQTLAQQVERQVVAVFPDTGTRDSRWTAATGLVNGAMCFITATGELQLRSGGAWVVFGGRASAFASAVGMTTFVTATASGYTNTVTLPTGRFSQAPIVVVTIAASSAINVVARIFNIFTTAFDVAVAKADASAFASQTIYGHWHAYQATSAAAIG